MQKTHGLEFWNLYVPRISASNQEKYIIHGQKIGHLKVINFTTIYVAQDDY